jgi:hypothetical protein
MSSTDAIVRVFLLLGPEAPQELLGPEAPLNKLAKSDAMKKNRDDAKHDLAYFMRAK